VVVGTSYFSFRIFLERVLGTVLRDDRDASLHLHVSRVVDRIHWVSGFLFIPFLRVLFERFYCPFRWSQPSPMQALHSVVDFGLYDNVFIFIIVLFIL
jgi:hypothetical protein